MCHLMFFCQMNLYFKLKYVQCIVASYLWKKMALKNKWQLCSINIGQIVGILSIISPLFLSTSLRSRCYQMLPECHLLVLMGRYPVGSLCCTQVQHDRRSTFNKSHNLFTICCLQVLPAVMLISPNSLGFSASPGTVGVLTFSNQENQIFKCVFWETPDSW